jgi:hypothetical protein
LSSYYFSYKNGGHACYAPFIIPIDEISVPMKIAPRFVFSEGVSREANANTIKDLWIKTIDFFEH